MRTDVFLTNLKQVVEHSTGAIPLESRIQSRDYVYARWCFFWIAYRTKKFSLTQIGNFLGRDHATVLHCTKKFESILQQSNQLATMYNASVRKMNAISIDINEDFYENNKDFIINELRDEVVRLTRDLELARSAKARILAQYSKLDSILSKLSHEQKMRLLPRVEAFVKLEESRILSA